jgi:phosphoribosylformimino-5-aminoimidazole carboxamide ribotide isomerase
LVLLPAIDIKDGQCVRLVRGDYSTAGKVAEDPRQTAAQFKAAGTQWLHMVDLDGALAGRPINHELILSVISTLDTQIEIGGGIRDMKAAELYINGGAARVILGSSALKNPAFLKEAVKEFGEKTAVGIDARDRKVAITGWTQTAETDFIEFAKRMEGSGVKTIIFTDISRDGTLSGPNFELLDEINRAVGCDIIASGGVSSTADVAALRKLNLYGAICGKAVYSGALDLKAGLLAARDFARLFKKSPLVPAVVQEQLTGEVLMLAYMNEESLNITLDTGFTCFYSRSRQQLWKKGETSGHVQRVRGIAADCDFDTLLIAVEQTGPACHTGNKNCFFNGII